MSRVRLGLLMGVLSALLIVSCRLRQEGIDIHSPQPGFAETARYKAQPANWKETEVDVFPGMNGITLDPSIPIRRKRYAAASSGTSGSATAA
jgi:hypothetical protein